MNGSHPTTSKLPSWYHIHPITIRSELKGTGIIIHDSGRKGKQMKQKQIRIPQIEIVTAPDPATLQEEINKVLLQHPIVKDISIEDGRAVIQYDVTVNAPAPPPLETGGPVAPDHTLTFTDSLDPDQSVRMVVELILPKLAGRYYCCDCDNYDWGKGCPYRKGRIMPTDPCCDMLNVTISSQESIIDKPERIDQIEPKQIEFKEEA